MKQLYFFMAFFSLLSAGQTATANMCCSTPNDRSTLQNDVRTIPGSYRTVEVLYDQEDVNALISLFQSNTDGLFDKVWNETKGIPKPDLQDLKDSYAWIDGIDGLHWQEQMLIQIDWHDKSLQGSLEIKNFKNLFKFNCKNNALDSLTFSDVPQLTTLFCQSNKLTGLDLSGNTELAELVCHTNLLSALDVTAYPAIIYLNCHSNQLAALDVTNNTKLTELFCFSNQLAALDITNLTKLVTLTCYENQLTELDVTNNTKLTHIYCYSNQLTGLDVTENTELVELHCSSNKLSSLDVTKNIELVELDCHLNQLTALDITANTALTHLYCHTNKLTALDITKNTKLTYLDCYSNEITALDVTNNNALVRGLDCSYNCLTDDHLLGIDVILGQMELFACHGNQLSDVFIARLNAIKPEDGKAFIYTTKTTGNHHISEADVKIIINNGQLIIDNEKGKSTTLFIYTLTGQLYTSRSLPIGTTIVSLPQGVYIIRAGEATTKVIIYP